MPHIYRPLSLASILLYCFHMSQGIRESLDIIEQLSEWSAISIKSNIVSKHISLINVKNSDKTNKMNSKTAYHYVKNFLKPISEGSLPKIFNNYHKLNYRLEYEYINRY